METHNSDFTAIHKDNNNIHILKAKIIDNNYLYFQMWNKTKNILTPVFKIPANYGILQYINPNEFQKELHESFKLTKNINRSRLVGYYMQFKLNNLANAYQNI